MRRELCSTPLVTCGCTTTTTSHTNVERMATNCESSSVRQREAANIPSLQLEAPASSGDGDVNLKLRDGDDAHEKASAGAGEKLE